MPGPIDDFCESLRSELHARRAKSHAELERIHELVRDLAAAREAALVSAFVTPLELKVPAYTGAPAAALHARLVAAVEALSEARLSPRAQANAASAETAPPRPIIRGISANDPAKTEQTSPPQAPASEVPAQGWPTLQNAANAGPIVIVGGARSDKLAWLPASLKGAVEWIETTRQGTHAIGNLAQRIRQRRVCALIVLDGLVGHKHSEPLVAAAREVKIPTAYANKGGTGALARAFTQLEKMVGAP